MDNRTIPSKFFTVTPSDTASLAPNIGLHVGGAGNVAACGVDGTVVTFVCTAATRLSGNFTKVMSTNTTATGIIGLGV